MVPALKQTSLTGSQHSQNKGTAKMSISKQEMALVHGFMSKVAENDLPDVGTLATPETQTGEQVEPTAEDASGFLQQFIDWVSKKKSGVAAALAGPEDPGEVQFPNGGTMEKDFKALEGAGLTPLTESSRTALDPSLMDAAGEWFANNKDTLQGAGIGAGAGGIGVPALVAVLSKLLGKGAPSRKSLLALAGAGALAGGGAGAYLSGAGEDPVIP